MNNLFDFNNPSLSRRLLAGSYRPERLINSALLSNLPKILPVDIDENENNYRITADLPGFSEDNISVNIENNVLRITAEQETRETDESSESENVSRNIVKERISHRRSERNINLGNRRFDVESITADLKNGVLTVTVPFAEESLPKKIDVKVIKEEDVDSTIEKEAFEKPDSIKSTSSKGGSGKSTIARTLAEAGKDGNKKDD